ncbi:MAG: hypothetical protein Kow00109_21840 [Acidobacteriota bacterium]
MSSGDYENLVERIVEEVIRRLESPATPERTDTVCGCGGCGPAPAPPPPARTAPAADAAAGVTFSERVLTAEKLLALELPAGAAVRLAPETLVTPLARDLAKERDWRLLRDPRRDAPAAEAAAGTASCAVGAVAAPRNPARSVAFYSARGGTTEETVVRRIVEARGLELVPLPPPSPGKDPAEAAVECIAGLAAGRWSAAVVMLEEVYRLPRRLVAFSGVKARVCWDPRTARDARRSGANVLLLSTRSLAAGPLRRVVEAWFAEE